MISKRPQFPIQDEKAKNSNNGEDYPTIADLMREQRISHDEANTVHHRRDLDSLG